MSKKEELAKKVLKKATGVGDELVDVVKKRATKKFAPKPGETPTPGLLRYFKKEDIKPSSVKAKAITRHYNELRAQGKSHREAMAEAPVVGGFNKDTQQAIRKSPPVANRLSRTESEAINRHNKDRPGIGKLVRMNEEAKQRDAKLKTKPTDFTLEGSSAQKPNFKLKGKPYTKPEEVPKDRFWPELAPVPLDQIPGVHTRALVLSRYADEVGDKQTKKLAEEARTALAVGDVGKGTRLLLTAGEVAKKKGFEKYRKAALAAAGTAAAVGAGATMMGTSDTGISDDTTAGRGTLASSGSTPKDEGEGSDNVPAQIKSWVEGDKVDPKYLKEAIDVLNQNIPKEVADPETMDWESKLQDIKDLYKAKHRTLAWAEIADTVGKAVAQLAVGHYGLTRGIDMSGMRFEPKDWSREYGEIERELDRELGRVDEDRKRKFDSWRKFQQDLAQWRERKASLLAEQGKLQANLDEAATGRRFKDWQLDKEIAGRKAIADAQAAAKTAAAKAKSKKATADSFEAIKKAAARAMAYQNTGDEERAEAIMGKALEALAEAENISPAIYAKLLEKNEAGWFSDVENKTLYDSLVEMYKTEQIIENVKAVNPDATREQIIKEIKSQPKYKSLIPEDYE
jgi:hypothetical protein